VLLAAALVANAVVAVQLAHERLAPQGSWGIEQMEVVTVDRHELPSEVTMGRVVAGAVLIAVSVGRPDGRVVEAAAVLIAVSVEIAPDGRVLVTIVVDAAASSSGSRPRVSNRLFFCPFECYLMMAEDSLVQ
jgi:hypothetical protein